LREGERESEREVHGLCYAGFVSVEVGLLIFLSLGRKEKETGESVMLCAPCRPKRF
jgi:hypothetical protein